MTSIESPRTGRMRRALPILAGLFLLLWACNQVESESAYLNLGKLSDTLETFDSVQVIVKDMQGRLLDTAYHGPVTAAENLRSLPVPHYGGGEALIVILGYQGGRVVYESRRIYDGAKGKTDSIIPVMLPGAEVRVPVPDTVMAIGDSLPLPEVSIVPANLLDKSVAWSSSDSETVSLERGRYHGRRAGFARLQARLNSDPAKQAGFTVQVLAAADSKAPDSIRLLPETLLVAAKGNPGSFTLAVHPASASSEVVWASLDTSIARVGPDGKVEGVREGPTKITAASKVSPLKADTSVVIVSVEAKPDSVRFAVDSLRLFVGGVRESLSVRVFPLLADQGVLLSVRDPLIAELEPGGVKGLREGRTWVRARSRRDTTMSDSLLAIVSAPQRIDSVAASADTVRLFTGAPGRTLTAMVFPASAPQEVAWRSTREDIASIDPSGKASSIMPGKCLAIVSSRVDSTRKDSVPLLVRKDTPRIMAGSDTTIGVGATLAFTPRVEQEYGKIIRFKWDLDGDGKWDDSSTVPDSIPANLSRRYDKEAETAARFYAKDTEGNDTTITKRVKAVNGPVILILSPADGSETNQAVIDVIWSVDGALQSAFTKETLSTGANTVVRKAKDSAGKEFTASIVVHLDQVPPAKPVLHAPTHSNSQLQAWTWAGGGGGSGAFRYRLDDQDMTGATQIKDTAFIPAKKLTEELHTLFVQEQDAAGNWSAIARASIQIDITAPPAPKVKALQASPSNEPRPTWTWTSGGGGAGGGMGSYRFRLDSNNLSREALYGDTLKFTPAKDLAGGLHTLYVQERDSAGNWSPTDSAGILLDLTAPGKPEVRLAAASPSNNPRPGWTWKTGGGGNGIFRYRLDQDDLTQSAMTGAASVYAPDTNLGHGEHTLFVQERDEAGNWSPTGSAKLILDLVPPAKPLVSFSPVSPMAASSPKWSWRSGGNGGAGIFRYRLDVDDLAQAIESTDTVPNPAPNLAEGKHAIYVQERDSVGNWSASAYSPLEIDFTPPLPAVFAAAPLSPVNSLQPTWIWSSGGGGGMGTYRSKLDDSILAYGSTLVTEGRFTPTTQFPDSRHTLYVQEKDSAGNWSPIASKPLVMSLRGTVGNAGFAAQASFAPSMAISRQGLNYVAYSDGGKNRKVTVMFQIGTGVWESFAGPGGFSAGEAGFPSIALTDDLLAYVAFSEGSLSGKAKVMRPNAARNGWEIVGNAGFSTGRAFDVKLAISAAGGFYVAVCDSGLNYKARVFKLNAAGTQWGVVGGGPVSTGRAGSVTLALGPTGTPYVAYYDDDIGGRATVMRLNDAGTGWSVIGTAGFSPREIYTPSLAISAADVPYLGFRDENQQARASVMRYNASATKWEYVGGAGFSTGGAIGTSLALAGDGTPYLAYGDSNLESRAIVMRLNAAGTGWEAVGGGPISAAKVNGPSLALGLYGVPHIAFGDALNGNTIGVMKASFDP